jgi:hypothetical protein
MVMLHRDMDNRYPCCIGLEIRLKGLCLHRKHRTQSKNGVRLMDGYFKKIDTEAEEGVQNRVFLQPR